MIEKTVFISYRRNNAPWALAIDQYLTHRGYDVFFDFISIGAGSFEKVITEAIKARAHFLVLLAPSALERCDDPKDWLRREIELAMEHKRNIIPVMLEGFDFGAPDTVKYLTGQLERLKEYNGLTLSAEYFDAGMQKLCNQFLNVDLETVSHPVSKRTQKIVEKQKLAVTAAKPVSEEILTAQEWYERAYKAKDPEEQIRLYTKGIELDGKNAYAYNNRGVCYDDLMQYEQAIQEYNQAIKLNPENAEVYNNRGLSYAKLKQYKLAIDDYNRAIQLNSDYVDSYYNKACSYAQMGNVSESLQWLRESLSRSYDEVCELTKTDSAFDSIRDEHAFQQLLDEFCGCE